jgi:peptidylprolyl isomerase
LANFTARRRLIDCREEARWSSTMKRFVLILLMAASTAAASAQTPAKPAAPAAKTATAAKAAAGGAKATPATVGTKLPPGVPAAKGMVKTAYALRYQEIKIGTGAEAESNKMYTVHYTGWLASNGYKFDSSYERRTPIRDKDNNLVPDADGKPKLSDPHPEPLTFPQGYGRVIPGWDRGFYGMKVGGKRRLFIPWQLAYGPLGHPTGDPKNPGIPPKADLIFDVELLDVKDLQMPAGHPGMGGTAAGHGTATAPATAAQPK